MKILILSFLLFLMAGFLAYCRTLTVQNPMPDDEVVNGYYG